jgi:hypothetical protein
MQFSDLLCQAISYKDYGRVVSLKTGYVAYPALLTSIPYDSSTVRAVPREFNSNLRRIMKQKLQH